MKREPKPQELMPLPQLLPSDEERVSRTGLDAELELRRMYGPRRSWREEEV